MENKVGKMSHCINKRTKKSSRIDFFHSNFFLCWFLPNIVEFRHIFYNATLAWNIKYEYKFLYFNTQFFLSFY